jgi:hypothetical protein
MNFGTSRLILNIILCIKVILQVVALQLVVLQVVQVVKQMQTEAGSRNSGRMEVCQPSPFPVRCRRLSNDNMLLFNNYNMSL